MKFYYSLMLISLLSGCVTVEKLEKMNASERANFICSRDRNLRPLIDSEESYRLQIENTNLSLRRGYHVHKSCQKITTPVDGGIQCLSSSSGNSSQVMNCSQAMQTKDFCTENPVALNLELEKSKLKQLENQYSVAKKNRVDFYKKCNNHVSGLSPEQALNYYDKNKVTLAEELSRKKNQ